MLSDYITKNYKTPDIFSGQEQSNDFPFADMPYYAAFLHQTGLKELKDRGQYFLVHQEGRDWSVNPEAIAAAMLDMQRQGDLKAHEALTILQFVIDKADRNTSVPPFVRSYVCRDTLTRVVLQRFKEATGRNYTTLTELSYKISDNIVEANEVFNSIRICDPACGSGLFLVTLLNEMIAIKSQLGILADKEGNPLFRYKVVADDTTGLLVYDRKNFSPYKFASSDPESRQIQETLLHEKKMMIENCLYGVDIEQFSVSISKLRLWVEVLKHVCRPGEKLQTFPLIEGNLRCGDALMSRFSLQEDLKTIFKHTGYSVADYKQWAVDYKNAKTKEEKTSLAHILASIKQKLILEITLDERNNKDLLKWQKELAALSAPGLFELDETEVKAMKAKQAEAQAMVEKYRQRIDDARHNPAYRHAIEWRYEFPELLSESGDFIGFDLITGIPPNVKPESIDKDVIGLYYELGYSLLKPDYFLSCIASNSWMKSMATDNMRRYLMNESNPLLMVEFGRTEKIDSSLSEQAIAFFQKSRNQYRMMSCRIKEDFDPQSVTLDDYIRQNAELFIQETIETTVAHPFVMLPDIEKRIKAKIEQTAIPLQSWDIQIYSGIKTGLDEAFIIDRQTRDEYVRADYKNIDIIKSLLLGEHINHYKPEPSNLWLICIPWHFPLLYDKSISAASEKAEERFRQQYPIIFKHLAKYRAQLLARNPKEVGVVYEWYALQHFGTNNEWDAFTKPKIVWKRETSAPHFCLDYNSCAIFDTTCFITGQHLKYLLGVLNSTLGRYMLRDSPRLSNGNMHISIPMLETMKIPVPDIKTEAEMISLVNKRTTDSYQHDYEELEDNIDRLVYEMYGLDTEDIDYIETNCT